MCLCKPNFVCFAKSCLNMGALVVTQLRTRSMTNISPLAQGPLDKVHDTSCKHCSHQHLLRWHFNQDLEEISSIVVCVRYNDHNVVIGWQMALSVVQHYGPLDVNSASLCPPPLPLHKEFQVNRWHNCPCQGCTTMVVQRWP